MQQIDRFEAKYRVTLNQYLAVRAAITPYMRPDPFTAVAPGQRYLVRSLYYDSLDHAGYCQKVNGDCNRAKFRLRVYGPSRQQADRIRVEIKARRGDMMAKYQTFATLPQYDHFLRWRTWGTHADDPVLTEYARQTQLHGLQPKVLVQYEREGFTSRRNEDIRLTFDHRVRSAHASCLFPDAPFFRVHHHHEIVLEIKSRRAPAKWVARIVSAAGLRLVANSKYTQGMESARHDRPLINGMRVVR